MNKHFSDALDHLVQKLGETWDVPREDVNPEYKAGQCPKCKHFGRFEHELTADDTVYVFYHCSYCNELYAPYIKL